MGALSTTYRSLLWAVLLLPYTSLVGGSISSLPQSDRAVCALKLQPRKRAAAASVDSRLPLLTLAHAALFWVHAAALIHSQVELHHRRMQECVSSWMARVMSAHTSVNLQAASPSVSACCGIRVMLMIAADQAESSNTEKQQHKILNKRGLQTVFLCAVLKVGDKPSASAAVACVWSWCFLQGCKEELHVLWFCAFPRRDGG